MWSPRAQARGLARDGEPIKQGRVRGGKLSILEHVDHPVGPPEVCVEGLRKVLLLLLLLCFVAPFTDQESEASHSPVAQRSSSNVKECS